MKNLITLLLIGLIGHFSLSAQNTIEGAISNEKGEGLVAATITLENEQDVRLNKTIQTDEYGYFIMDNLADGPYRLVVENTTYKPIKLDNFEFPRDTDQILGLTMESLENTDIIVVRNTPNNYNSLVKIHK